MNTEDVDWYSAIVDDRIRYYHYTCAECHKTICVSPRLKTVVLASLYCTCEDFGPPYVLTSVVTNDNERLENPESFIEPDDQTLDDYLGASA